MTYDWKIYSGAKQAGKAAAMEAEIVLRLAEPSNECLTVIKRDGSIECRRHGGSWPHPADYVESL